MTVTLASIVAERQAVAPTAAALSLAQLAILDTSAVILAGADAPQTRAVQAMLADFGSSGADARAMILGTAAHALDFDDYEDVGSTHPSACLVPALLALAARQSVTQAQMLAAYVAGYEAILAFGHAMGHSHYLRGWHATATLGCLGAAMASSFLLRLTAEQTAHALSIAATRAAGLKRQFGSGVKALHCGLAAKTGVQAAGLARAGLVGQLDILEGPDGVLSLLGGASEVWPKGPVPRISDHPPIAKPWPSCGYTHRTIEAALLLRDQLNGTPELIERIVLTIPQPYFSVAAVRAPRTADSARFSVSWCIAKTLITGDLLPAHFSVPEITEPAVQALEARVEIEDYPLAVGLGDMSVHAPDTLTLHLRDGRVIGHSVAVVRGAVGRALGKTEIAAKFLACGGDPTMAEAFLIAGPDDPFFPLTGAPV